MAFSKEYIFKILSLLLFNAMMVNQLSAQVKYEREVKIKKEKVPEKCLTFISSCFQNTKVKWFKEYSLTDYSYEVKTKVDGKKYSIEFDSLGTIEDVEIDINYSDVDEVAIQNINQTFNSKFKKFNISKIQLQWTGSIDALKDLIKNNVTSKQFVKRYEIVVDGYEKENLKRYEYLFSEEGKFILVIEVLMENTDILDY